MTTLNQRALARNGNSRLGLESVGELPLGPRKILRASFDQIDGHQRLHLRRWRYDVETRAMRPTGSALLLNITQLPQLYDLIGRALAQARREGLVFIPHPQDLRG